ncbi:uncharacterized protein LOC143362891 [Halictus rubicundus]|uniref:uncharacterized protein LOC143362891 n=1 Tax=Halictus rubicundus TaxID=77578 RepID=UPI00403737F5
MAPRILYEIRDIDPTLEKEELREEIARSLTIDTNEIEIKTTRIGLNGTKTAIISLPTRLLEKVPEELKIKIGFTMCRMRRTNNLIRCYKCHGFGHLSYNCKYDFHGKELCRRCGKLGHNIKGCEDIKSCVLCIKAGIPAVNAEHVAGAADELEANIVFISEPLYNPGEWIFSKKGTAAIWARDLRGRKKQEDGDIIDEEISILADLIREERAKGRNIIIGRRDFNSKSPAWGSDIQNDKGSTLLNCFLDFGLNPLKPEGGHTYERGRTKLNIDFIAISKNLTDEREITSKIIDKESASDHKYLLTNIRWKMTKTGLEKMTTAVRNRLREENLDQQTSYNVEEEKMFLDITPKMCEKELDSNSGERKRKRKNNVWWNQEIREAQNKVYGLRRKTQRYRKRGNEELEEITNFLFKKAKRELQRKIAKEKEKKWKDLCDTIEKDPWGKPYKTIMRQIKPNTPPASISENLAVVVLKELFPENNKRKGNEDENEGNETRKENNERNITTREEEEEERNMVIPMITRKEMLKAIEYIKPKRAAGLDGCNDTSSVINAASKLLEYLIRDRFYREMGEETFNKNQFGFVKGKSTVHAMEKVAREAMIATEKQRFGAMIAIDVRNAFNTLNWEAVIDTMKKRELSPYLIRFTKNYFKDREVAYATEGKIIWRKMEMGVPQGSVLGPMLWNMVYDELLEKPLPPMSERIAFADDIIITVQAATLNRLKLRTEEIIEETRK